MKNKFLLAFILLIAQQSFSQNFIFQGVIGNNQAVLGFEYFDGDVADAAYYLEKNRTIVHFIADTLGENEFIFFNLAENYEDTMSKMILKMRDSMFLDGFFWSNDGIRLEAHFHFYNITTIAHNYAKLSLVDELKIDVPFQYVYTSNLKFNTVTDSAVILKNDKIFVKNDQALSMPSVYFSNLSAGNRKIINFCDSVAIEHVIANIDCELDYKVDLTITRFDEKVVSLLYKVKWNCGGSDADYYYQGYTFNRENGALITLKQLFNLKDEETDDDSLNSKRNADNEQFLKTLVAKTLVNDGNSLCDYDNYPLFNDRNFYVTKTDFCLLPTFDKAIADCRGAKQSTTPIVELENKSMPSFYQLIK